SAGGLSERAEEGQGSATHGRTPRPVVDPPPMNPFRGIEGQPGAHGLLTRALRERRLASAYLFEGPSGVGKERTALALATHVVAGGDEALRRRVAEGNHPDVRIFRPRDEGSRNLPVEVIREEVLPVVQFAPFEAQATFLVF